MYFNLMEENSSGFAEGYAPARFLGIEEIETKYGKAWKLQFAILADKAGDLKETAFRTGVFVSTKDGTGSLRKQVVSDFFEALELPVDSKVEIPTLDDMIPEPFQKPVMVYLKRDADKKLNMSYENSKIIWPYKKESSKKASYI